MSLVYDLIHVEVVMEWRAVLWLQLSKSYGVPVIGLSRGNTVLAEVGITRRVVCPAPTTLGLASLFLYRRTYGEFVSGDLEVRN